MHRRSARAEYMHDTLSLRNWSFEELFEWLGSMVRRLHFRRRMDALMRQFACQHPSEVKSFLRPTPGTAITEGNVDYHSSILRLSRSPESARPLLRQQEGGKSYESGSICQIFLAQAAPEDMLHRKRRPGCTERLLHNSTEGRFVC